VHVRLTRIRVCACACVYVVCLLRVHTIASNLREIDTPYLQYASIAPPPDREGFSLTATCSSESFVPRGEEALRRGRRGEYMKGRIWRA
jgi:hypothetical protein